MPDVPKAPSLGFAAPAAYTAARQRLESASFHDLSVCAALGIKDTLAASTTDMALLLHRTRQLGPLDTFIRLFLLGVPVEAPAVRRALAPMTPEQWIAAGVLRAADGNLAARIELLPFQGLWLAFDRLTRLVSDEAADYVMGLGRSSITLATATVRRPVAAALDLGSGSGYQALRAAGHCRRVVASDRNPRALEFARFNAALNGLENIEFCQGDLLAPAAGQSFDLIVSNPPFVVSPETRYIYRDSGLPGDAVVEAIVRQAPRFLAEGGYCQILGNWVHPQGGDWRGRLRGWWAGSGCDMLVMQSDTLDAAAYAAKWITHTEHRDTATLSQRLDEWIEYYRAQGIEAVSGGLLTLRRRTAGENWFDITPTPDFMRGAASDSVQRAFAARDFLQACGDDGRLLEQTLRVAADVELHQTLKPEPPAWALEALELRCDRGLAYKGEVDIYMAQLMAGCDGRTALGELVARMAVAMELSLADVTPVCLRIVRNLLEQGFLEPPGATGNEQGHGIRSLATADGPPRHHTSGSGEETV